MNAQQLRQALQCAVPACKCHKANANVHCPNPGAHNKRDTTPSLSVTKSGDKILFHCQSSSACTQPVVLQALIDQHLWETEPTPMIRPNAGKSAKNEAQTGFYQYKDAGGVVRAEKARFETPDPFGAKPKKRFAWRLPGVDGWPAGESGVEMHEIPLFGADLVAAGDPRVPVVWCEGENAALACRAGGLLAVSFGGGATSANFGGSLDILAGRDVLIWPDADTEGRKYAYRVESALRSIARKVVILRVNATHEKDDAVEFFAGGGTPKAITDQLPLSEPAIEWIDDDAATVRIPVPNDNLVLQYEFTEIVQAVHELSCIVSVSRVGPGFASKAMTTRVNAVSGSGIEGLVRRLGLYFPAEKNFWFVPTQDAANELAQGIRGRQRAVHISAPSPQEGISFLVDPILPEGVPSMWFGDGESAKSWIAIATGLAVALGDKVAGLTAKQGPVVYLDWETDYPTWKSRMLRVGAGLSYTREEIESAPIHYLNGGGTSFPDLLPSIRKLVADTGAKLAIIDSVSSSSGGPLNDDVVVQRFTNAFSKLKVTILAIAHISKEGDGSTSVGSIQWRNQFRRQFFVKKEQRGFDDTALLLEMHPRKVNDGPRLHPVRIAMQFQDPIGPITLARETIGRAAEIAMTRTAWERIANCLTAQVQATKQELSELTGLSTATVTKELSLHGGEIVNIKKVAGKSIPGVYMLNSMVDADDQSSF